MKLYAAFHCPSRMNPEDFGDLPSDGIVFSAN